MEQFDYISPMKAKLSDLSFLRKVSNDHKWAAGEKFDGYREIVYLGRERNEMFSSLGNSHIDKVPQFKVVVPELAGTVIDCEGLSPTRRVEDNASCFKSDPPNAIAWQDEHGMASLVAFDVLRYRGIDTTKEQFGSRRVALEQAFSVLQRHCYWNTQLCLETLVFDDKLGYCNMIMARTKTEGHEGVILKDMFASYLPGKRGKAWLKVKRTERREYYIKGFYRGCGDYNSDVIGSIIYGTKDQDLGSASGIEDDVVLDMTNHPEKYIGKLAWFDCQEITDNGVMRHPRYKGMKES